MSLSSFSEILPIYRKFEVFAEEDRVKATLAVEGDLENIKVDGMYKWNDCFWSELPSSSLPKTEKNAQTINEILIKSWETQGSIAPSDETGEKLPLITNQCQLVNGLLMYYFKSLNIADNMKRVVGLKRGEVHSFLIVGDHIIDNTFCESVVKAIQVNPLLAQILDSKCYDVDPADPENNADPKSSGIGLKNERLVFGKEEKMEQMEVWISARFWFSNLTVFDTHMRKFIKEKYGVAIDSLANKWVKLCWNCYAATEELKKCSKCLIARYCGKSCQVQDWKVHKILHKYFGLLGMMGTPSALPQQYILNCFRKVLTNNQQID